MKIKFTKMHGIGNDFIVIDGYSHAVNLTPAQIKFLADRQFGIGCDQLLMVERTNEPGVDFRYRIFNADGGEVEQCGNGARCFVRYVHDKGLTHKNEISVETAKGIISLKLTDDGLVTVNMGAPRFTPADIPFVTEKLAPTYALDLAGQAVTISAISMGNPHAVQIVDDVETAPVTVQGPIIESHPRFPQRVNAGFMQIMSPQHIKLRVFERGSGETLACGSGACAAVVAGIALGHLKSPVRVTMRGGELNIAWAGREQPVMMTGPAETVFEGEINLD